MSGFGLIHLGFLAAAAAVAVPVVIHLLLRPRAQRVEIGSIWFLQKVLKDSTRRRKLRRWLLLALRSVAVLLLALLFARPFLRGARTEGRNREVVILIDQSASMSAVQSGRTLFAQAQQIAEKVVKDLPQETAVHLAYFDAQGVFPAAEPGIERNRQPGFASTDYSQALRWASDQVVLSPRPERTIVVVTDLQRSGLRGSRFEGFPENVAVEVVEVGRPLIKNLAVVDVDGPQTVFSTGKPVVVAARVLNAGPFAAQDVKVRLTLAGPVRVEQGQTVSVGPNSRQEVKFTVLIPKPGIYTGKVEISSDDDFPLDNRRWLALDLSPPDRLLLVDGEPGRTIYSNETYYLEAALRLRRGEETARPTPYEPERLPWGDAAELPDLRSYRLVCLCNVGRLSDADVKSLVGFVSAGGSLLVFTGSQVLPVSYEPLQRAGLLPAAVAGTAGPDLFSLRTWNQDHPVFRPLSDPQQGDLRRISFTHITRLKPAQGAKVLAEVQSGEPLIVEGRLGRGSVLLFASAADRDWSDWPKSRLYVPLVHQVVGYLTKRLPENQRVQHGAAGPGAQNPPGVEQNGPVVLVRNLEPAESEIERLTVQQFREALNLVTTQGESRGTEAVSVALRPGGQRPDELWVYVLWALLLVLIAEVFVANRANA